MNNRELKNIIYQIQEKETLKVVGIAKKADVNRSYLSTLINSEEIKPVEPSFLGKLSKAFPDYFNQQKQTGNRRLDEIITSLNEIREYTIAILTGQSAGHEVIMGALDRIEEKPEGSLSAAADKLALQLSERLNVIQKGSKAGMGT